MHENEGRGSERVIADDLVVSSTPRRIRRTSNSSADRYRVPGGLAREGGLRQGARGGRSNEEGGKRDGGGKGVAEWVSAEENERWCLWGAGVAWRARGRLGGVSMTTGITGRGGLPRGETFPSSLPLFLSGSASLSLFLCCVANFWFSQRRSRRWSTRKGSSFFLGDGGEYRGSVRQPRVLQLAKDSRRNFTCHYVVPRTDDFSSNHEPRTYNSMLFRYMNLEISTWKISW